MTRISDIGRMYLATCVQNTGFNMSSRVVTTGGMAVWKICSDSVSLNSPSASFLTRGFSAVSATAAFVSAMIGPLGKRGRPPKEPPQVGRVRRRRNEHPDGQDDRSEERRVGKEGRSRWSPYH